jgi:hypothetical protein
MAQPQRQLIIDNVETTLAAISTGGGFRTDVFRVERLIRLYDDVGDEIRPWIGFIVGRERFEYQPGKRMRVTIPCQLLAYVKKGTQAEREDRLNEIHDDIFVALNADQTRGGNAVMTTVREDETDEGIGEEPGDGVLWMLFDIVYFRTTSAS